MKSFFLILLSLQTLASFLPENMETVEVDNTFMEKSNRELYEIELDNFRGFYNMSNLEVRLAWERNDVNAYASREDGLMVITILGGLIRHKQMNIQTFQTILCHELGHHFGGVPYKQGRWATVEGKSDYYATNTCLKEYIANEDNQNFMKMHKDESSQIGLCASNDYLCQRLILSGKNTAEFSHKLSNTRRGNRFPFPKLTRQDSSIVTQTMEEHPAPQCRLDTFKAGILNESYPKCWYFNDGVN
ncbi:hypothetical protein [Bacteriovorax sp. Seq25_V]|uniref:hypothetical protein n=1 Tax=Bacteriovorax sp. Seq25_V TaxID=1201288 RepID=UPI000389FBDD|nr:hypothetical protein [Bacteriovorax sp. Seq25_V]EQC43790.1 hypothetical protein M900_1381 [Bacteriovorax sp. Seq25_V]